MDLENFFKSKNRDTEIYTDVRDKGKFIGKLIDKIKHEKDFDISADVRRNVFVTVCIDKQDFHLMLFPTLEQAENFAIGRGNIVEPINIKLTQSFDE
jgi:adenylosuccinate synthase